MSRIFTNGCETGSIYSFDVYAIPGGDITAALMMNTTVKRTGDYCLMTGHDASGGSEAIAGHAPSDATLDEIYLRCYVRVESGASTDRPVIGLTDALGKRHVYFDISGKCYRWNGAAWALLGTASAAIPQDDSWHLLEIHVVIASSEVYSDGTFTVKIDGVQVLNLTSAVTIGGDVDTDPYIGQIIFGNLWSSVGGNTGKTYFDDIGVNDTDGSRNNTWIGAGAIYGLKPNGVGSNSDMTPHPNAGEDNYDDVDEVPPDDDTTYVAVAALADVDTYEFENLCDSGVDSLAVVNCITYHMRVKMPASGTGEIAPVYVHQGTLRSDMDSQQFTDTDWVYLQHNEDEDPVVGGGWSVDVIDQSEFGFAEAS